MGKLQTLITKLLVANRAEIASRVFRTCRELGILTVAVFTDADADLPFVAEADEAIRIGAGPINDSYLAWQDVLKVATDTGADAIHPGYGFSSENADFAAAVADAGICWIGPSPTAIRLMGDKSDARRTAVACNVPTIPGYDGDDQADETFKQEAARIGFPVMVKAAAGGGGRGIRAVHSPDELPEALSSARRESLAGFGSDKLLLEKLIEHPRHIEVQVMGDGNGNAVHLFERECSIQRRHQKVVEEAPSAAVDEELRARLGETAVRLAEHVNYAGAGTVEFLLAQDGSFYFLEMNTRLQVEHGVTELVTGIDLVAAQIAIAEGAGLPWDQDAIALNGHAIQCRIVAEDPMRDYMPATGKLLRFDVPKSKEIRVDSGFRTGNVVSHHYDAMLAKIMAWGPTRKVANRRLRRTIDQTWIPGLVTNLPLLRQILRNEAWAAGALHTGFLAEQGLPTAPPLNADKGALYAAIWHWHQDGGKRPWGKGILGGFRLLPQTATPETWVCTDVETTVSVTETGARTARVIVDAKPPVTVRVISAEGDALRVRIGDLEQIVRIAQSEALTYVHFGAGEAFAHHSPRFPAPIRAAEAPGSCTAPTPGTIAKVHVAVGETVRKGQVVAVLEAMKMEHPVIANADGIVAQVRISVGDAVDEGTLLITITPAEEHP